MCKAHLSWPGSPTYPRMPTFWIDISLDWATLSAQSCLVSFLRSVKVLFACRVRLPFGKRAKVRQFCGNVKIWESFFLKFTSTVTKYKQNISICGQIRNKRKHQSKNRDEYLSAKYIATYPPAAFIGYVLENCHDATHMFDHFHVMIFSIHISSWCPLWGLFLEKIRPNSYWQTRHKTLLAGKVALWQPN